MTAATMRKAERGVHLFWGLALVLYVSGLLPSWGEPVVRWLVIPGIAASGFAMWFAAPLRRLGRRARVLESPVHHAPSGRSSTDPRSWRHPHRYAALRTALHASHPPLYGHR
jgi:hypothetical protein